jgi:hypothetical protein
MEKISRIIKSEWAFVFFVVAVGMLASLYPMFYELLRKNSIFPDRYFVLVYNYAPDFNAYLSKIIQGIQGKFLVSEYFTSEPHSPSLLQIFYLWVGRIGGMFSPNPEFSYHLARVVFGLGWMLAGYLFIKFSFASKLYRKLAFLLFVFGGNFPKLVFDQNGYGFLFLGQKWEQSMVGWSNLDPVRRMTFIPHWNAGHLMSVLSLLFFIRFIEMKNRNILLVFSILFGIFAGLILPPTLIIVYATAGLWILWNIFLRVLFLFKISNSFQISNLKFKIISYAIYFLFTFPTLVYNVWITQIYPWKALVETDLYVNKIVFPYWEYLVALGPMGILGLLGGVLVLILRKEKFYWSSFWVLGMYVLIIVFDKMIFWHDQTRFLEVGPELPLAILSVVALSTLFGVFGKLKNILMLFAIGSVMLMAVFLFSISIKAQTDFINHKILGSYPPLSLGNYVVYPFKTIMSGVFYLKNNATQNDVILSGDVTGNHIGAYAGRFVYVGHGSQTVHFYGEKVPLAKLFYQGGMSDFAAKEFLKQNRISLVFYGPEEKTWGDYPAKADYFEKVFENRDVVIYRVNFKF